MKALVKLDYEGSVELQEIDEPHVTDDSVKVEVKAAGICGTDLHILKNEYKHNVPVVMGHEFSGIVVDVGKNVSKVAVGDRVVSQTAAITCGLCDYCIAGIPMLCSERQSIGSGVNGAFAKYLNVNQRLVFKIPENVSLEAAALTEPLACIVHGLMEMTRIKVGDIVLVSGPGTIGLLAVEVANAEGGVVIVCGTRKDRDRLKIAKEVGAAYTVEIESEDIIGKVMEITDNLGVDVAVECAGAEASGRTCLQALRGRGRYHQMGLYGKPITVDLDMFAYKEIAYSTSFATTLSSYKKALQLMALGKVNTEALVSAKLLISQWKKGFDMLERKEGLKTLLYPE